MATVTEMEMLAGKAMYEARFRRDLFADPYRAAKELGITLDESQVEYIRQLNPDEVDRVATQVQVTLPLPKNMAWGGAVADLGRQLRE